MRGIKFLSGCGVAAVLLLGAYGVSEAVPPARPPSSGEYQQAQADQPTPELAAPTTPKDEQPGAWDQAQSCDNSEGREESDLCQQWRMAEASEELVRLTDRQNALTAIEAGLLFVTIAFTAWAAIAAWIAAKAARESVSITEKTAKATLRAYVCPGDTTIEMNDDGSGAVSIKLRNAGQTPAHKLKAKILVSIVQWPIAESPPPDINAPDFASQATLSAGAEAYLYEKLLPDFCVSNNRAVMAAGNGAVLVRGIARYADIFAEERTTTFRLYYRGPWSGKQPFRICPDGNDAD